MNRIGDYALIGDCQSAALVGRDGSIDWACFPRFDSPAVFAKILDEDHGGCFSVEPEGVEHTDRWYLDGTNVLVTRFACSTGVLELTDCMPVQRLDRDDPAKVSPVRSILRRLRCTDGVVDARVTIAPRFEYGSFVPRFGLISDSSAEVVGGADALWVSATRSLDEHRDHIGARWRVRAGEEVWIEAAWTPSIETSEDHRPDPAARLDDTVAFWRAWIARCEYDGDWSDAVRRSALVLKLLTYAPTGAVVAAPTTSLPEAVGGARNWDYRYTWIRDATLTLASLVVLGFREEADAFKRFLERTGAGRPQDLQIMYGIGGERSLPELELSHLSGHRGSSPVRIGNGAAKQMQLDAYGQLLQAAYLFAKAGGTITPGNWTFLEGLCDIVCTRWREPDHGIWEMRDEPRHFVHSKLNCWVALDRGIRLATLRRLPAPVERWARERDELRGYLLERAAPDGWFQQSVEHAVPDASTLLVPAVGFVPSGHPTALKTIEVVQRELGIDGLLYRYLSPDGLEGGEGAFLLCSFWLLDCLSYSGRLDRAEELLQRLLGLANDVGLYAEEADPRTGELLGNFPQAFTHMALVTSCAHLSAARRGEVPSPDVACDYAEHALERLLSRTRPAS